MRPASGDITSELERYLRTGEADPYHAAWAGTTFIDCERKARDDLVGALVAEVQLRSRDRPTAKARPDIDSVSLTRRKIEPLVRGLFPRDEQDAVLALVERPILLYARLLQRVEVPAPLPAKKFRTGTHFRRFGSLRGPRRRLKRDSRRASRSSGGRSSRPMSAERVRRTRPCGRPWSGRGP